MWRSRTATTVSRTERVSGSVLAIVVAGLSGAALVATFGGCGQSSAISPFVLDAAVGGGGPVDGGGGWLGEAGPDADPTLGGPCNQDEQCDDEVTCTFDSCDQTLWLCRFVPDDSVCQNGLFCDGLELCDGQLGCVAGAPVSCSDGNPCTINTCNETTKLCESVARDVDEDGDPDIHCSGGDCNDFDPLVSSLVLEVCANLKDDDCDYVVDEADCVAPAHDTCLDPLELSSPGGYVMNTIGAQLDYAASCGVAEPATAREVVALAVIPAGDPVDLQVKATCEGSDVALALLGQCGSAASEISCSPGYYHPADLGLAKVRGRNLGSLLQQTLVPIYVITDQATEVSLQMQWLTPTPAPSNETCGTAIGLQPSVPVTASLIDPQVDLATSCKTATGELVYRFVLDQTKDIDLYGMSADGDGLVSLSLRSQNCALPADEITCSTSDAAHIYRHSLAAGTYYVSVAATAPTEAVVTLELSAPTTPPLDEDCQTAPAIAVNQSIDVLLAGHQDDIATGCLPGAVDAAYTLDLVEASDVLLAGRWSPTDSAAVMLLQPPCTDSADQLLCGTSTVSPARAAVRNLAPGSYRVAVESEQALPLQLTAFVRPAVPPTIVPFADNCADALPIPAAGGFFQGTTANASADFSAGCDQAGSGPGGARDQLLKLELSADKRVVLDMMGSGYATLLDVRQGPDCPGTEVAGGCAAGYHAERSFLDLELAAGTYFIQVDGFATAFGPWFLDVRVVDP